MQIDLAAEAPELTAEARFDALFRRFYPELYGLAFRLLGDAGEAEETVQEVFLRLARSSVFERPEAEVGAWLRRVCLNLGANRLRAARRARAHLERAARLETATTLADDPARLAQCRGVR